jgi:hypothetical protein
MSRTTRSRMIAAVVLLIIAIAAVAVWRSNDSSKPGPKNPPPTTASTVPLIEQQVLRDYRAFWDAYLAAANPMRPDDPALQQHATGDEIKQLVESFSAMKAGNEIIKGNLDLDPKVTSVNGNTAAVRDCIDDHSGIYDATTGERKDQYDPNKLTSSASLTLVDGVWKVDHLSSGGTGCTGP